MCCCAQATTYHACTEQSLCEFAAGRGTLSMLHHGCIKHTSLRHTRICKFERDRDSALWYIFAISPFGQNIAVTRLCTGLFAPAPQHFAFQFSQSAHEVGLGKQIALKPLDGSGS